MTEISTIEIAQKQRHLLLLGRVRGNQALTKAELEELYQYEQMASRQKQVVRVKKPKNREPRTVNRRNLYRISQTAVRRLGYECADLAEADSAAALARPLAEFLGRDEKLMAAWERGQFLRNLKAKASVVDTVTEAASALKLQSGQALREILDTDLEAANIWFQTRLDTRIRVREAMLEAAKEGNQKAISVVENYLKDDQKQRPAGTDLTRLIQKEIADLFDVTRITVNDWTNKHRCPRNADGSYNLYEAIKWYDNYLRSRAAGKAPTADTLRDMKAEQMKLDLAERKGQLLPREEVVAGLVARAQAMVGAFTYKRRELASMCHGQTVEGIEDILSRFFEELQRKQLELPDFLELPAAAEEKFNELLEILTK